MNGLTATRQIIGKYPQAKILMVTQHDDAQLKEAAVKAGAKGFILKENLLDLRRRILTND